jgi:UPF0176 protein
MRRAVLVVAPLALLGVLLAGCAPNKEAGTATPVSVMTSTIVTAPPSVPVPPAPTPATTAECPYIDQQIVADDNGEHVGSVKISSSSDGQPHPTCFFYRPDGHIQLTIRVYVGTADVATSLVNQAAPIATSSPATSPAGWNGGTEPIKDGAIYAVSKGGDAVIVTSNQLQTIKVKRIAVSAIEGLKF